MVLGISGPVKRSPKASLAFESALDPSSVEVIEEGLVGEYWSQLSHPGDEDITTTKEQTIKDLNTLASLFLSNKFHHKISYLSQLVNTDNLLRLFSYFFF